MAVIDFNNEQNINVNLQNEQNVNVSFQSVTPVSTQVKDLNYIPAYKEYEEERQENEIVRQNNEITRQNNETIRVSNETTRIGNESTRVSNENLREAYINELKQSVLDGDFDGAGISTITKTSTSGLVDTYTITYDDGRTETFNVTNGAKGDKGDKGEKGDTGEVSYAEFLPVQSDTNDLLNNQIKQTTTSTTITDGANMKMETVILDGRCTQNGTPTPDNPSEIEVIKARNLIDNNNPSVIDVNASWVPTENGGKYSNTATWNGISFYFKLDTNKSYTFSYKSRPSNVYLGIRSYTDNTYSTLKSALVTDGTRTKETFTPDSPYIIIRFSANAIVTNALLEEIQLEEGTQQTDYLPYQCISVNTKGKNLWDISTQLIQLKLSFDSSTGIYTASDNDTRSALIYKTQQYTAGQLYISGSERLVNITSINKRYYIRNQRVANSKYIRLANLGKTSEFTLELEFPADIKVGDDYTISFEILDNTIGASKFRDVQLEKGLISDSIYSPYINKTTIVNLKGNELCSIGDVKDTLDVTTGIITKRIRHLSLNVSDMNNSEEYPGWRNQQQLWKDYPNLNNNFKNASIKIISNISNNNESVSLNTNGSNGTLFLGKSFWGNSYTQTYWKTNYPNLVYDLYYVLKTPQTVQITGVMTPTIYKETTYVSNSEDTNMTITYYKDLGKILDNKVDKVTGKGLSTNDYTNADKSKLDGINLSLYSLITETGNKFDLTIDSNTYVMTLQLKDKNNNVLSTGSIDLPLETMVVGATYDNTNKKIVLTLKNSQTIDVPVGDLVSGLVPDTRKINNKPLSSDITLNTSDLTNDSNYVSDGSYVHTDNNYTTTEKEKLSGLNNYDDTEIRELIGAKYSKPNSGIPKTDLSSEVQTSLNKADSAIQEHQSLSGYATEQWVENKGYLIEHQDISGKLDTSKVKNEYSTTSGDTYDVSFINGEVLDGMEYKSNKVTSISSSSTDSQYPSAKCVYDLVGDVESILTRLTSGGGVE